MERRTFLAAMIALPGVGLLAACGSEAGETVQSSIAVPDSVIATNPSTTNPPITNPPITNPTGVRPDVVLSYTEPGGFTTAEFAFQNPPLVIITGDGRIIGAASSPTVFPGPLLAQHTVRTISDGGVEAVLAAADAAGLLADVEYERNDLIADASTATLTIEADGVGYVHEATALGLGGPESTEASPRRQALLDFLTTVTGSIDELAGADTLGAVETYEPAAYQLRATPIDDVGSFEPQPSVETWPTRTGIALADASDCVEVARELVGDLLERADQSTFFADGEAIYQVTARPAYPGRHC